MAALLAVALAACSSSSPPRKTQTASKPKPPARTASAKPNANRNLANIRASGDAREVVMYALGLLDVGYKFGGSNPETGLDCSGMAAFIYKMPSMCNCRITPNKSPKPPSPSTPARCAPGYGVFQHHEPAVFAYGIYIGDGKFIHARAPTASFAWTPGLGLLPTAWKAPARCLIDDFGSLHVLSACTGHRRPGVDPDRPGAKPKAAWSPLKKTALLILSGAERPSVAHAWLRGDGVTLSRAYLLDKLRERFNKEGVEVRDLRLTQKRHHRAGDHQRPVDARHTVDFTFLPVDWAQRTIRLRFQQRSEPLNDTLLGQLLGSIAIGAFETATGRNGVKQLTEKHPI